MPLWSLTLVLAASAVTALRSSSSSSRGNRPKLLTEDGEIQLSVGPTGTVAAIRSGSDPQRVDIFQTASAVTDLQDTLNATASTIRVEISAVTSSIREEESSAVEAITASVTSSVDALRREVVVNTSGFETRLAALAQVTTPLLRCAARNQFLGAGGQCVSVSGNCPVITLGANMTATIQPPGLALERLPGATATFACPSTGFVPTTAPAAICLRNGTWGAGGIPSAGCRACSNITAQCSSCGSGRCDGCADSFVLTAQRTCSSLRSCTDVTSSGTYTMSNGVTVYCLVADGKKWTKISSWGQGYSITASARNAAACSRPGYSQNCKLADSVINSFVSGNRLYRVDANGRQNMYLYTSRSYVDTQRSWGSCPNCGDTRGIVRGSFPGDSALRNGGGRFRQSWIDFLYINGHGRGESCERFFIGHGPIDCYGRGAGYRCIRGGGGCGGYAYISGWQMYIADI